MSEGKSKSISLRKKKTSRPTISAPRQISEPRERSADSRQQSQWETQTNKSGNTAHSVPREGRPSLASIDRAPSHDKTSDLVKRRYSTRFAGAQPVQDGLAPPVPAMPRMPAQYAGAQSRSRSPSRDGRSPSPGTASKLKVDLRALQDPNLQADKYVQSILAEASENDILAYQSELQNLKQRASTDLQHNVFQNRTQFIKISKEADKLKSEMGTLRTLMSELTGALGHATSAGGAEIDANSSLSMADRKRANRSSVANLEAMWSTHLQTLYKRVEGSQKYLPAVPGRHILLESQRWVELNAATWKPRRRVAIVLLNDHLLVASEKKRHDITNQNDPRNRRQSTYNPGGGQSQTTLVADRCWALQDVTMVDITTSSSQAVGHSQGRDNAYLKNAINVRAGSESFTYATPEAADKAGILVAFRKAQEDLRKRMAAEHSERERHMDDLAHSTGRETRLFKMAAANEPDPDAKSGGLYRSNSVLIDAEGRSQSVRAVESQIDSLDIDIALQHFDSAVSGVEKLRKLARSIRSNQTASDIILAKVNERASKLAVSIARQLVQTSGGMERTKVNVTWLLRLGFEEVARTRYLEGRTETMRVRTRQLPFTGALPPYVHALAYATFALILHTFRTFAAAFPATSGSAVVRWAKERVDEFNGHLERQLSTVERGGPLWQECLGSVREQAAVLEGVGVDFKGLVARGLIEDETA